MQRSATRSSTDPFLDVGGEDPRFAFTEEVIRLAEVDDRIVVLDADVSRWTLTRNFRDRIPERFWDMGVAEQNVMGVTAAWPPRGAFRWPSGSRSSSRCGP